MIGPYAASAWLYRKAGWQGIIPIGRGPGQKSPPPTGFTGWAGVDPSGADVQTWIDGREGDYNPGLHLPPGIVAVDVDGYHGGDVTLAVLVRQVGTPLLPTFSNTARGRDSPSRHRFYRATLAEGRVWRDHPGGQDGGIDLLHVGHRYAVVWPATNPQAGGATYTWYGPDGGPCDIPSPGDLPELPPEWVEALSQDGAILEGSPAGDAETMDAVRKFRPGPPCPRVIRLLRDELDRIAAALDGVGGLHMPGPLYSLTAYGLEGHAGVGAALSHHQAVYTAARVASRGESQGFADAEWWRQVRGAVGKKLAASGGAILGDCDCGGARPRNTGGEGLPIPGVSPDDMEALRAELAAIPDPAARLARARQAAGMLAVLDDDQLLAWRDMLKEAAGLRLGDFDTIIRAERARTAEAEAEARRERHRQEAQRPDRQATQLPNRNAPAPVAHELVARFVRRGLHLRFWRGDWYDWQGTHYDVLDTADVRHLVQTTTEPCWYDDDERGPQPWNPDTPSINKVVDAMGHGPAFVATRADAESCIALTNCVLDARTFAPAPHTPARFNTWALPYAYDPAAACPQWLAFLGQVIPDVESQVLLQQWFGYMISGRTDLQKILSLFGARRSGKGTILRVLNAFIGKRNVASQTLETLAGQFGRESLIGKTLLQITDANWKVRDLPSACDALKAISGEDDAGVPRKNRTDWQGTLMTKIVLVANEEPRFNDPSGALLERMIHIEFTRTFAGQEDIGLTARLLTELPGVFNWALAGLVSLNAMGRLIVPAASRAHAEEIELTTSPVAGFLRDRCVYVDPAACVATYLDDLYVAYARWAARVGRVRPSERDVFARDLYSATRGRMTKRRVWVGEGADRHQAQAIFGVELLPVEVPAGALGEPSR